MTLVDIRAWDTMGEISVLLVAATGVASLVFLSRRAGAIYRADEARTRPRGVGRDGRPDGGAAASGGDAPIDAGGMVADRDESAVPSSAARGREWLQAGRTLAPQRRSVIFEVVVRLLFHTMIVYSVFLLFSGHNAPGGGFAAGLVDGHRADRPVPRGRPVRAGRGGARAAGSAARARAVPVGRRRARSRCWPAARCCSRWIIDIHLPVIGDLHLVTSLFFDIGVYLVVVGLVLDILRSLGAEIDRRAETGEDPVGGDAVGGADRRRRARAGRRRRAGRRDGGVP